MAGSLTTTGSSWTISDTASKTITFTTGMLEAATSDNISPVALRCCESFGSLLSLCTETRYKVEQLARRNHTSHVLNFVKAQIGYKKGDSVEHLSRSDAGIRFLCLAATLCTLGHYDAANRLDALLQSTAQRDQVRPTIKQLQVLMETLKTKMILSDFAKLVAGCEIVARSMLAHCGSEYAIDISQVPSRSSLQNLVLALNELGGVGELNSIEIKLKPQELPWTWGFIQWCLGVSPTLRTSSGECLLAQRDPLVTLTIMPQTYNAENQKGRSSAVDRTLEVAVQRPVRAFKEIVFMEDAKSQKLAWQGLVDVRTWIRYRFSILHDRFPELKENERLKSAIGQALYFIIFLLPDRLLLCNDINAFIRSTKTQNGRLEDFLHLTSPRPFLDAATRLQIAEDLLHDHIELIRDEIDLDRTLEPSKLASLIGGVCRQCAAPQQNSITVGMVPCRANSLLESIGDIGSAILTLTLFGPIPETYPWILAGRKFNFSPFHHQLTPVEEAPLIHCDNWRRLVTSGWQPLMHKHCEYLSCPPIALFKNAATRLLGQPKIRDSTIISSQAGQVVFPAFFEADDFMREGFMRLSAFAGTLRREDMDFDFLLDVWSDTIHTQSVSKPDLKELDVLEGVGQHIDDIPGDNDDADDADESRYDMLQDTSMGSVDESIGHTKEVQGTNAITQNAQPVQRDRVDVAGSELEQGHQNQRLPTSSQPPTVPETFSAPQRSMSHHGKDMTWKITIRDEVLRGELYLNDTYNSPVLAWSLIEALTRSRLTPPCLHKPNNPAGPLANDYYLRNGAAMCAGPIWHKTLINVGRAYTKQLASLNQQLKYPPAIVHVDGCVKCALQLCSDGPSRLVIS